MDTTTEKKPFDSTTRHHKRDVLWQIVLPMTLGVLAIIALGVIITITTNSPATYPQGYKLANISTIALICLAVLFGLVVFILLGVLIYAAAQILKYTPLYAKIAQSYVFRAGITIHQINNVIVEPVLKIQGWKARLETLASHISPKKD